MGRDHHDSDYTIISQIFSGVSGNQTGDPVIHNPVNKPRGHGRTTTHNFLPQFLNYLTRKYGDGVAVMGMEKVSHFSSVMVFPTPLE